MTTLQVMSGHAYGTIYNYFVLICLQWHYWKFHYEKRTMKGIFKFLTQFEIVLNINIFVSNEPLDP